MAHAVMPAMALAATDTIADTVRMILEAHFERFTVPNMDKLCAEWGEDAPPALSNAANLSRADFLKYLEETFSGLDAGFEPSKNILNALSCHATGAIDKECDPIWPQVRAISDVSDDKLQEQIGLFFSSKMNGYLFERNPVANDVGAPGTSPGVREGAAFAAATASHMYKK
jgi:hypothetical protein